jgi:hypothetical protein
MSAVALALSPSWSVIVAVSVTRLSAASVFDWSVPLSGEWMIAPALGACADEIAWV